MRPLLIIFCLLFVGAINAQGISVRGGGHEIGLEFMNAFAAGIEEIRQNQADLWRVIQANGMAELPLDIRIYVEEKPLIVEAGEGQQDSVVANHPATNSIWINHNRWRKVVHPRIRQAIALHEVFSLKGLEGTGRYPISGAFLAKFNLRNDAIVFFSGQDPSLPQWKSRRMNCERRNTLKNEQTGKLLKRNDFSLYAQADWKILDRVYSLQFVFATETGGNWPAPINVPSLIQTVRTTVSTNGNETLFKISGQALQILNKKFTTDVSPEKNWLLENLGNGKTMLWEWKSGKKGEKSQLISETTLSDGSVRRVSENLKPVYIKPVRQIEGINECVEKIVPGEEWLALSGDKEMGAAIEKLNARALLIYEANRAYQDCAAKNCGRLKHELDLQQQKFVEAWNRLFQEQKAKLKKRFTPARSLMPSR